MFDKSMTMESHVNYICKKAFLNIKNISMIRKSLNKEDTKTVVNTSSGLWKCSLVWYIWKTLKKITSSQNLAARLIERLRKHDRITHIRKELHWLPHVNYMCKKAFLNIMPALHLHLPISSRIEFELLNVTWKALNNESPP